MKTTAGLTFGFVLMIVLAATPGRAAEISFPLGGRIGLVPPGAMTPSPTLRGFEDKDSNASIVILELPSQAYPELEKELAPAQVAKGGITEEKRESVTLESGHGLLVMGEQSADTQKLRKWVLIASMADLTALVSVQIPASAKSTYSDAVIRDALASVTVRAEVPLGEQLQLVPFQFGDLSGLRPFRVLGGNTVILTEGPNDTVDPAEQPILVVSIARGGPDSADRARFARNLFGGFPGTKDVQITGSDLLRLGKLPTHEIQADALDAKSNTPLKLVQWVGFGSSGFLRFVGMARVDAWPDAFPRFRAVRDAIKAP